MIKAFITIDSIVKLLVRADEKTAYYTEYSYDDQILDKLFTVIKKLNIQELNVLFDSTICSGSFQNGFVTSEIHSGDKILYNYVSKSDLCKMLHLANNMKIQNIHCWDKVTYITSCVESGCAVFASNDIYCILVIQNHIPIEVYYTRVDQIATTLVKIYAKYKIKNFINADSMASISYVQNIEDFLEIDVPELLPVLNVCGFMEQELRDYEHSHVQSWIDTSNLTGVASIALLAHETNVESLSAEFDDTLIKPNKIEEIPAAEEPKNAHVAEPEKKVREHKKVLHRSAVDIILTVILIILVASLGVSYGISRVISSENGALRVELDTADTELKTKNSKLAAMNLDSHYVTDVYSFINQIPIDGLMLIIIKM